MNKTESISQSNAALDAEAIRTFVAVCETGSFRQAAEIVHRSPAAISGRIAKLENQLGRTLFVRTGRNLQINDDGKALLAYGRRMLALNREIATRFDAYPTRGHVRFGAPDDYGTRWLPSILKQFATSYPAIEVSVTLAPSGSILTDLEREKLDIGLITLTNDDPPDLGQVVHKERLVWFGAEAGSAAYQRPLPLALADETCAWRHAAIDACTKAEIPFRTAITSEHYVGQLAAVLADFAVAPLPESIAEAGIEKLPSDVLPPLPDYTVRLVKRPASDNAVLAFEASILATFSS